MRPKAGMGPRLSPQLPEASSGALKDHSKVLNAPSQPGHLAVTLPLLFSRAIHSPISLPGTEFLTSFGPGNICIIRAVRHEVKDENEAGLLPSDRPQTLPSPSSADRTGRPRSSNTTI